MQETCGREVSARSGDLRRAPIVDDLKRKLANRARKAKLDDKALERRARALNREYFEGQLAWTSIRWVVVARRSASLAITALPPSLS